MNVPCFWIEPTGQFLRFLRVFSTHHDCGAGAGAYCDARHFVAVVDGAESVSNIVQHDVAEYHDPRWPKACARCGRDFHVKRSQRQLFHEREMRVVRAMPGAARAVGATCHVGEGAAIAGAMWDATWYGKHWQGPDGLHLVVMLPNGHEWAIDSRANNCTMPNETTHRCWVRHGVPPNVTVDKRGNTCQAGSGSILSGDFHGFLRAGALVK